MFQNMLMTSLAPLSSKTEMNSWENRPFARVWPENIQYQAQSAWPEDIEYQVQAASDRKDTAKIIRRSGKRFRTAFTTDQLLGLENAFARNNYVDRLERSILANSLKLSETSIKVWFQNRRMKKKKENLESSSDSSSECFSRVSLPSYYATQLQPTAPQITNQYYSNNANYFQLPPNYAMNMGSQCVNIEQSHDASELPNNFNKDRTVYAPYDQNNNMNTLGVITDALKDFYELTDYSNEHYTPL